MNVWNACERAKTKGKFRHRGKEGSTWATAHISDRRKKSTSSPECTSTSLNLRLAPPIDAAMVLRQALRRQHALPALLLTSALAISSPTMHLDALPSKKPIYDELPQTSTLSKLRLRAPSSDESPPPPSPSPRQTATSQLAAQISNFRQSLYPPALRLETQFNDGLSRAFKLESSFTTRIAALAPPVNSGERVLPNGLWVLVSALAGSMVTRNRGILLRSSVPVAAGVAAGWLVVPVTMRNVAQLTWEVEGKVPGLQERHEVVRKEVKRLWETSKAHSGMTVAMVEDKVGEAREGVEGWVKGK
ncbi:MAG: hypothetical protein M1814_006845 [Vezdaea aestivalis]|nr:MAG: hypothetical protein M1814_006845 [Vezdaea aestivalis]